MSAVELSSHLQDPARLAALRAVALLDTPSEEAFDRLSRLAARLLDAPIALVSLVDTDRQFFKSCIGLEAEPFSSQRQTPLTHSFCQHNRVVGQPLVVEDARIDPAFSSNLAVTDLDVVAYLGFPLATSEGFVLGSFCVIDTKPRKWATDDIEIIRDLAASVMVEIQLRTEVATRHQVEGERDDLTTLNDQLFSEIAARKLAEEQQRELEERLNQTRKIEAIGQLAGGIAHDLNNLLAPILIYTSIMLKDEELAAKDQDIIDQIQNAGLSARDLIRQLLTFSRMQAMQFKVHHLNDIVTGIEGLLRRTIPEDVTINLSLRDDIGPLRADANQIEQIVMNLVVNAADAMPNGGALTIATGASTLNQADTDTNEQAQPGRFVTLTVSDTGVGMSEETQQRVFEPFFSTKGTEGNGLGLATVMGIVHQHDGIIECSSEVGHGTHFRVHLPETNKPDLYEPDQQAIEHVGAATILIAEDDQHVRDLTRLVLGKRGHQVFVAANGQEALELIAESDEKIHLLVTDVVMPGMNGRTLYETAKQFRPDLEVLYMSGYNDEIIHRRGVLETGTSFIAKPFTEDELLEQVNEILSTLV